MRNYWKDKYRTTNVCFFMSTLIYQTTNTRHWWYTVRSLIMCNLWSLPAFKLVSCWRLCTISNCELIKSKQNSGSMPVASGQTDFVLSSTKHCVSFCDIFLVILSFLGSSIADKLFETSYYSCLTAGMRLPNNTKEKKRSIVEINWANF